ncbi:MAG: tripartite tricarboxylate transporter TctB family protein [Castellaniella sp.]|uniref:tripartite tricarboxylate transporter TctB family protein n=1 Tax=Castellaniella sp. TaxID=1955812 RepID=UPI0011FAD651|nr:tripartite tricarboxylate transporter TctB family protein [Castellaniella sp.]TAN29902.1 MAG: tripartite tricarboxylate transporter TctB family protein [Castellaniella sp.]
MMAIKRINKDYYGGALMVLFGLGAIAEGTGYHLGTLRRMGPGFFPAAVGALMVLCGIIIALEGLAGQNVSNGKGRPEWRGWLCITGGIVAFILLGKYTGLLPATFSIVFISALGDRQNTLKGALILSVAVCAVAVAIFWWALGIQFPLIMWGAP